tara:strand:+ start:2855 stop:3589 length:735 start_codon:yes stop_codon:yes gene_type:complete
MDTFKRQFRQNQITLVVLVLAAATGTSALTTWLTTAELSLPQRLKDIALAVSITFVAACVSLYYTVRLQIKYLQLHLRLDEVANTDDLTGLPNRRSFVRHGKHRLAADRASQKKLGLLMVDVDWFKRVNDTYGHDAGDETLRHIAAMLQQAAPDTALVSRLGGEEFTVMCEGDSLEEISAIAEALRRKVESTSLAYKREIIRTTISIGVAIAHDGDTLSTLLSRADKALYEAKSDGRNRLALVA